MLLSLARNSRGLGLTVAALGLSLLGSSALRATAILPTSYSYTNSTPAGESIYTDALLNKLTNGDTGSTVAGDGSWVGWQTGDSGAAQITFNFAASQTIGDVSIDFLRSDAGNTQLPESVTIGSTTFLVTDFGVDQTKGFVDFTGTWKGSSLVVTLNHATNHWIFANEVTFSGSSATPEPASLALVFAGLAAGAIFARKRQLHK